MGKNFRRFFRIVISSRLHGKDMELGGIDRMLRELPRQLVKGAVRLQTVSAMSTTQDWGKIPRSFGWRNYRQSQRCEAGHEVPNPSTLGLI